jgi:hypothetical protein
MPPFRYRDDESVSTGTIIGVLVGVAAGFAAGMFVAQRAGGVAGLKARFGKGRGANADAARDEELDDYGDDELEDDEDSVLEERVLEAFRNDPVLCERAIDIGSVGADGVELAGWVETDAEASHAVTIAGGTPGVRTVVNRLLVGSDEERFADTRRRAQRGDPSLTEAGWNGNTVGTGRRRQGTSAEVDRHADPNVDLEQRWSDERDALRNAADDIEGLAERRRRRPPPAGDRTGGSPVAPSGVPKADHVANPTQESGT